MHTNSHALKTRVWINGLDALETAGVLDDHLTTQRRMTWNSDDTNAKQVYRRFYNGE